MRYLALAVLPMLALSACKNEPVQDATSVASEAVTAATDGPPPMTGDPSKNPDMTGFAKEVDADGDGKLTRAEWQAKGLPDSSFNMFEQGRGYVTLEDYQKNPAPEGIDLNGDGALSVAEFKAFDKQMAAKMAAQGKAAPKP